MDAVVQYFDERKGFWRIGHLEKSDSRWAWVRTVVGRRVRVPIGQTKEVEQEKSATANGTV
jgi:hypothetical protein